MDVSDRIKQAADHVFEVMSTRVSPEDLQRIKDAYELASVAHSGQKRRSRF